MVDLFEPVHGYVFFAILVLIGALEQFGAIRHRPVQRRDRWFSNAGLFVIGALLVGIAIPVGIVEFAASQPPGPMSRSGVPFPLQVVLTFLLLDGWNYLSHRLFHRVPVLWRAHLVHHSDTQVDVTTSQRHHPLEGLLSAALMLSLVAVLGLPALALALYLLVATASALLAHANFRLPAGIDRRLRLVLVTPAVHGVHHSAIQAQTDSNYGMVLTVWDRLFGSYRDPETNLVPRTGLEYFNRPQDTALWQILLQPFLFRAGSPDFDRQYQADTTDAARAADADANRPTVPLTAEWKSALVGTAIGCVLVLLVAWPTLLQLTDLWQGNESYRYGWLVIPMVAFLMGWHFRNDILASRPRPDFTGVAVALAAALLWGASTLMHINVGSQIAFVLALHGVTMSALGWRTYWRLFPILALLFLMVPSGDVLQPVLRLLTLQSIGWFASLTGLPHHIDGFSLSVGSNHYFVVDACSGLSYVTLLLFLGYCFGLMLFRSLHKIIALALFAATLGFLSNVFRVNTIVWIDWLEGSQMPLTAHGQIQWIGLIIAMSVLFLVLARLAPDHSPVAPKAAAPAPPATSARGAPVAAGLVVLVVAGVAAWLPSDAARTPQPALATQLPTTVQGWTLATPSAAWVVDTQGDSESLTATYRREGRDMQVRIIGTLAADARLSQARLAPGDTDVWRELRTQKETSCLESPCLRLSHTHWHKSRKEPPIHVYYAYGLGSASIDSRLAVRAAQGWSRLSGSDIRPRLIALSIEGAAPSIDDMASVFRQILIASHSRDD